MHRGLVALSASAVAAIYMAGYLRTQAADTAIGAADVPTLTAATRTPVIAAAAPPTPTTAPRVIQRQPPTIQRLAPTPQPTPATSDIGSSSATQAGYRDGTFTGQGTSRRGDVWVSVQIQGGRIASVSITRSTLQYPLRDIAGLPSEVVQRQSAQVDIVSRATYSSTAFRGAVAQALASARA